MPNEPDDKHAHSPEERPGAASSGEAKEHPAKLGGFEIIESIGKGGMGDVYKARQVSMDRLVALKILSRRLAGSKGYVQRFVREARAAARLNHPNIVQGIDVGKAAGCYYFAMEFIDGETAHEQLWREGPLKEEDALRICMQVAQALQHAHDRADIIHRDVKPQNILIDQEGVAKLADLGLARHTEQSDGPLAAAPLDTPEGATPGSLTAVGITLGTPDYISPEQIRGETDLDGRCDVYALGATLYHLLAGQPAYSAGSANIVMAKHLSEPVPDVRAGRPDISPKTAAIVWRAMQKDRRDRYSSAEAMAAALEDALNRGNDPATVAPSRAASPAGRVSQFRGRSSQLIAWIAGAALVAAVIAALVWSPWSGEEPITRPPSRPRDVPKERPPERPPEKPPTKPPPNAPKPGKASYEEAVRLVRENKRGGAAVIGELRSILAACRGTEYEDRVRALLNRAMQQEDAGERTVLSALKARADGLLLRSEYARAVAVYATPPKLLRSPRAQRLFQAERARVQGEVDKAYRAKHAEARSAASAGAFDKAIAILRAVEAWGLPHVAAQAAAGIAQFESEKAETESRARDAERAAVKGHAARIFAALKSRDYTLALRAAGEAARDQALGKAKEQFKQFQSDIGLCESLWQEARQRLLKMKSGASIRLRGIKRSFVSFNGNVIRVKNLGPILLREMRSADLFGLIDTDYQDGASEPLPHFKRGLFYTLDKERKLDRAREFFKRVAANDKAMAARGRWYIFLIGEVEPEQGAQMVLDAARAAARNKNWTRLGAELAALEERADTRIYKASTAERSALGLLAAGKGLGLDALFSGRVALKGIDDITITYDLGRKDHRRDWRGGSPRSGGLRLTRELRWKAGVNVRSVKFRLRFPGRVDRSELRLTGDENGVEPAVVALFGLYQGRAAAFLRPRTPTVAARIRSATTFVLSVNLTDTQTKLSIDGVPVASPDLAAVPPKRGSIFLVRSRAEAEPAPLDVSRVVVTGKLDVDWARARLALLAGIARSKLLGTVRVAADKAWTDTDIDLAEGKYYLLRAEGRWRRSARASGSVSPLGLPVSSRGLPYASLIGRTDKEVFTVGDELVVGPGAAGRLLLGMNEIRGGFFDNSGALSVEIREVPGPLSLRYVPGLVTVAYGGTNFEQFARRGLTRMLRLRDSDFQRVAGQTDQFSVRWTGYLRVDEPDAYQLGFVSDDGFRMWLDGRKIFDVWKPGSPNRGRTPPGLLTKGYHRVTIEFFDQDGDAYAALYWRRSGRKSEVIPASAFFHAVVEQ